MGSISSTSKPETSESGTEVTASLGIYSDLAKEGIALKTQFSTVFATAFLS